jgi:hypothetical protein
VIVNIESGDEAEIIVEEPQEDWESELDTSFEEDDASIEEEETTEEEPPAEE